MPYKDPEKQKEFKRRWATEHPEYAKKYNQDYEKRDDVKQKRKKYRLSEQGKLNAAERKKRYIENHGGYAEVTKNYASRQPGALRNSYYKHEHGVTAEEFEAQIAAQNNLCPIGNHPFGERGKNGDSPCQDHDHDSGKNRMVLCRNHNVALGLFHDSIADMENGILYLKQYQIRRSVETPAPI
jgi:hypothetical protein